MRTRFFHFHAGSPGERTAKILASAIAAFAFAVIGGAMTNIRAANPQMDNAPLHFTMGCPTIADADPAYGITVDGTTARIAWTTTVPTDVNVLEYWTRDLPAQRVVIRRAETAHVALLEHLTPGTAYGFRISATRARNGVFVQSPTCTFSTPGDDRTAPYLTDIRVVRTDTTAITVAFTTDEPAIGWVTVDPAPGTSAANATTPRTAHALTVPDLAPATTYTIHFFARDAAGNTASSDLPITATTLRDPDRTPPTITDLQCTGAPGTLVVQFRVSESPATGHIAYGITALDHAVEGAPVSDPDGRTTITRRLDGLAPATNYRVRATGIDGGGNAVESETITCSTR